MAGMARRLMAGIVAGAAGTLAMDLLWYGRYRADGGEDGFAAWELSTGSTSSFEEASAPGQVARKVADAVGIDLPDDRAGLATDVVHWGTGMGYGVGHALLQHRRGAVVGGLLTGAGAFANSYATLGAIEVYEPPWAYDATTLGKDLSAHLVYGAVVGVVHRLLVGRAA
jgi:hypothetical protein